MNSNLNNLFTSLMHTTKPTCKNSADHLRFSNEITNELVFEKDTQVKLKSESKENLKDVSSKRWFFSSFG